MGESVTIGVSTVDGSATTGSDYTAIERFLTFTSEARTQTLSLDINDDALVEDLEDFRVHLMTLREDVMLSASTALVTIEDDDVLTVGFVQSAYRVLEDGGSVTLTVSVVSGGIEEGGSVTVGVSTVDGSATTGSDYTAVERVLTFTSEATTRTLSVDINDDELVEGLEDFRVHLMTLREDVILSLSTAVVTIEDDDVLTVGFVQSAYRVLEDGGSVTLSVSVLSGGIEVGASVTVGVSTVDGSATTGSDYTAIERVLTFTSEARTQTLSLDINDDALVEDLEKFTVHLTTLHEGVTLSVSTAMVTISDNDVGFSQPGYRVSEDVGSVTLTVSLLSGSLAPGALVTVSVTTMDAAAMSPEDYADLVGTVLILTSGTMTLTVSVDINDDAVPEDLEEFTVHLATLHEGVVISASKAVVTIEDDDASQSPMIISPPSPGTTPSPRRRGGGGGGGSDNTDEPDEPVEVEEPPQQPVAIVSPNKVATLESLNTDTTEFDIESTIIEELDDEELVRRAVEVRLPLRVSLLNGVDITIRNSAGSDVKMLEEALRVCFTITDEITQRVNGDYEKLTIYHLLEESSVWEEVASMYDAENEQVCGDAKEFSVYALGLLDVGVLLPPTGGMHMPLWALVPAMFAGILLIITGLRMNTRVEGSISGKPRSFLLRCFMRLVSCM